VNASSSALFTNVGGGDYHLAVGSPAIGVGTSSGAPAVDFEGNARGSRIDAGAYQGPNRGIPQSNHVFLVALENHGFADVNTSSMPYTFGLAQSNGGIAQQFYASTHGSLLDYIWLTSGSGQGCNGTNCPSPITADNLFRQIAGVGKTWRQYLDGNPLSLFSFASVITAFPGTDVFSPDSNGCNYYGRHEPAKWYSDIQNNTGGVQSDIRDFSQFGSDLSSGATGNFNFIVPDGCNDAHDGSLAQADTWIKNNLGAIFNQQYFQAGGDGVFIVWFDESDLSPADNSCSSTQSSGCGGHIFVALIGPGVKQGFTSNTNYQHPNLLKTIEELLGTSSQIQALDMSEFF